MSCYDEFALLSENAEEYGLPWAGPPAVERRAVEVEPGRCVSALVWGHGDPEAVLLHGGAQNAHTWDTVALALARPLVAVDLPGHGHSDWRDDHDYRPATLAADLAPAVAELAPQPALLVGMSLGGLAALCVAADDAEVVRRLVLVDVTPGVSRDRAEPILTFLSGPQVFGSFDELLERTIEFNPQRSVASLRRGVLHNARERSDGTWTWRWDPAPRVTGEEAADLTFGSLWDAVERARAPLHLVRGGEPGSVVGDDDVEELRRRRPDARVTVVPGSGHSVQGDRPLELARLLAEELAAP